MKSLLFACLVWLTMCVSSHADWLAFRGPASSGVAEGDAPISCDEKAIKWEVETPGRGVSSPIVVGDQVVVTASSGQRNDRLHVISYDAGSGEKRWHRQFWATGRTLCHPTSANAAPTPASDGELPTENHQPRAPRETLGHWHLVLGSIGSPVYVLRYRPPSWNIG